MQKNFAEFYLKITKIITIYFRNFIHNGHFATSVKTSWCCNFGFFYTKLTETIKHILTTHWKLRIYKNLSLILLFILKLLHFKDRELNGYYDTSKTLSVQDQNLSFMWPRSRLWTWVSRCHMIKTKLLRTHSNLSLTSFSSAGFQN